MRVLLVSTYELGHQPLHAASPAAALSDAGHEVQILDLSVDRFDRSLVDWADAVAFSVPMHTAMRLALEGAAAVRSQRPDVPVCLYGLYAAAASDYHAIAGEYEPGLVAWVDSLCGGARPTGGIALGRQRFRLPVRAHLPALDRYARLAAGGEERLAGYVEASHGCAHRCRHCPVPVVYDGRTRRIPADVVLDDISQQVAAGARHITFGDPDFLNRWAHSMQITDELHRRHPGVTYDVTTKVSHLLDRPELIPGLARTGCLFVVSAFECVNDAILGYLDKGHTAADASRATMLLRENGIAVRPSWLPFTPWTTVGDVAAILDFVVEHDLVGSVDPVQYTIKLLIPPGSLMLSVPEIEPYLGPYDDRNLSYSWRAADEDTVELQARLTDLVARRQRDGAGIADIFEEVYETVTGRKLTLVATEDDRPRLTEPWFCCAEPTSDQFELVTSERT
jgi:radical SAM superfamily enzyme YgiQ (UPF0313 family)